MQNITHATTAHTFTGFQAKRIVTNVVIHATCQMRLFPGKPHQLGRFATVHRQRFLTQHMLVGCQCGLCHRVMMAVGNTKVYHLNSWVGQCLFQACIGSGNPMLAGKFLRFGQRRCRNPRHLDVQPAERFQMHPAHETGANQDCSDIVHEPRCLICADDSR